MSVILFSGPTLTAGETCQILSTDCLPPVAQGDVYRAALRRPFAIGIIDGYFESVPSVWHKEILWAMSQGIHVFGSASMGALRAAELAPFGMIGVGAIYEAYRDGLLEDDDEVAVAHGPAENGYCTGSEAMVNIRATLAKAEQHGILTPPTCAALVRIAKARYYPERSYAYLLDLAAAEDISAREIDSFRRWLPTGAVNQKRDDALAMLFAMREFLDTSPAPKQVSYFLEETTFWEALVRDAANPRAGELRGADEIVLDELRRDPDAFERAAIGALGWWLALEQARRAGLTCAGVDLLQHSEAFCRARGLIDSAAVDRWLDRNHCTPAHLEQLLARRSVAAQAQNIAPGALEACLLDYLRWAGDYEWILERAPAR